MFKILGASNLLEPDNDGNILTTRHLRKFALNFARELFVKGEMGSHHRRIVGLWRGGSGGFWGGRREIAAGRAAHRPFGKSCP
jgi:hypothetical protein